MLRRNWKIQGHHRRSLTPCCASSIEEFTCHSTSPSMRWPFHSLCSDHLRWTCCPLLCMNMVSVCTIKHVLKQMKTRVVSVTVPLNITSCMTRTVDVALPPKEGGTSFNPKKKHGLSDFKSFKCKKQTFPLSCKPHQPSKRKKLHQTFNTMRTWYSVRIRPVP